MVLFSSRQRLFLDVQAFIILKTLSPDPAQGTDMWSVLKSLAQQEIQQDAKRHLDSTQQEDSCTPTQNPAKKCLSVT